MDGNATESVTMAHDAAAELAAIKTATATRDWDALEAATQDVLSRKIQRRRRGNSPRNPS